MPTLTTSQGVVHYEVEGSGPPVILIHGWTQAWNTWRSTIETFQRQYRMYAPDLYGFGESKKEEQDSYVVDDFVEMIAGFMDELGMVKVPIMGHSMGGTTALKVALKYPERVRKVAVVGSPINGKSLSIFLKIVSNGNIAHIMLSGDNQPLLRTFLRGWSPFVARDPNLFYNMTVNNASGFTVESFYTSIDSLRRTNISNDLHRIKMPAMGIYGAKDVVVHPGQVKLFRRYIPHGKDFWIKKAGHFPMWDTPDEFNNAFREFMSL